jgi:hypothetical protein
MTQQELDNWIDGCIGKYNETSLTPFSRKAVTPAKPIVVKTNDDYRGDLSLKKLIQIDDAILHDERERPSFQAIKRLFDVDWIELKSNPKLTDFLYLEYGITVDGEYQLSGISISKSDVYRMTCNRITVEFGDVEFLKWLVRNKIELGLNTDKNKATNYIGEWIEIPLAQLFSLQDKFYNCDEYRQLTYKKLFTKKNNSL